MAADDFHEITAKITVERSCRTMFFREAQRIGKPSQVGIDNGTYHHCGRGTAINHNLLACACPRNDTRKITSGFRLGNVDDCHAFDDTSIVFPSEGETARCLPQNRRDSGLQSSLPFRA